MKQIAIDSPAVAHGLGLFETMLVTRGRVVLLEEHLARMTRSAAALGFPTPDGDAFRREAIDAAATVGEEAALRCLYVASSADEWTLAAEVHAIPTLTLSRRAHGRVITLAPTLTRALPEHKMTSYAPCVIGLRRAAAMGADEGLFVTREGLILEGTATNVFALANRKLITAPASVLPGIMRAWVLEHAATLGLAIEERCPSPDELREGAFLTGSLTLLAPIQHVNGDHCRAPGEVFEMLVERWQVRSDEANSSSTQSSILNPQS
jgi:branched-subunit amino acid aminotransferase/4-amino-4-deoxychorismate lyase